MNKRIIFMGSPDFAIPPLQALIGRHEVVGVVTQPDRPAGRGKNLTAPPVKLLAQEHGIPLIQPHQLKNEGVFEQLAAWDADFIVVAAFGQILRQNVLDLPKLGCINVHGSILPRWRGAAPIQAAIYHGDAQTGITIMKMDRGIDTGDILTQRYLPIEADDTSVTLAKKLSHLGAELLVQTLDLVIRDEITPEKQDGTFATYAPMIRKEEGLLECTRSAAELERQIRAYFPWPGSFIDLDGQPLKIFEAAVIENQNQPAGVRYIADGYPVLATSGGGLKLLRVQPAGRKAISGREFLLGYKNW